MVLAVIRREFFLPEKPNGLQLIFENAMSLSGTLDYVCLRKPQEKNQKYMTTIYDEVSSFIRVPCPEITLVSRNYNFNRTAWCRW